MPKKSKANRRRPRTAKTYQHKLDRLKKWYAKREKERAKWESEKTPKDHKSKKESHTKLKPLEWYVEKLRKYGQEKSTSSITTSKPKKQTVGWW